MKDIIEKNYKSILKRGLITKETTIFDFVNKIKEELEEYESAINSFIQNPTYKTDLSMDEELADIILTCLNTARHFGIDIEYHLNRKIKINQNR